VHRRTRTAIVAALAAALCASCGAGPSDRPGYALERPQAGAEPTEAPQAPGQPELSVPQRDLGWADCKREVFDFYGLDPAAGAATIECARFSSPLDPGGRVPESLIIELVRARLPQTPVDAAPLVLATGTEQPSSRALSNLAAAGPTALLAERPVVAIDRRGIGRSNPISCLGRALREEQIDLGILAMNAEDAADQALAVGRNSATTCSDQLTPIETLFTAANAANDLEELRRAWNSETLALLGVGDGATTALAYAAVHPDRVSRLILDGPPEPGGIALVNGEHRARGTENAIATFLAQCSALGCPLGPDPAGALRGLLDRASAGELMPLTAGAILTSIRGVLGDNQGTQQDRVRRLADALAAARDGRPEDVINLSYAMYEVISSDGQFVGRCSDLATRATADEVRAREEQWARDYPYSGRDTLLRLLLCSSWAALPPAPSPSRLEIPVLLIDGTQDPRSGSGGTAVLAGQLGAAGATTREISWRGMGHGATLNSDCAQRAAAGYTTSGEPPASGTICPQ
jgi:pimeloyl-ACP methyl ester carboxylesterase